MASAIENYVRYDGTLGGTVAVLNYWSFCDLPTRDAAAWSLLRAVACFVSVILAVPATHVKIVGYAIAYSWVLTCAALVECSVEVFNYTYYRYTVPQHIYSALFEVWAPQSTAYNVLIDAAGALCGLALVALLNHFPTIQLGVWPNADRKWHDVMSEVLPDASTGRGKRLKRYQAVTMLRWADFVLYAMVLPFVFTFIACWATLVTVRHGGDPTSAFRVPTFLSGIVEVAMLVLIAWITWHSSYLHTAAIVRVLVPQSNVDYVARVKRRALVVWGSAAACVTFTVVFCLGQIIPGKAGLYFQPLVFLGGSVVILAVVRPILGIKQFRTVTRYDSSNFIPSIFKHRLG
jgi:hypothetical protein